jgi:hypothetical protein
MAQSHLGASREVSPAFCYGVLPGGYVRLMILPPGDDLDPLKCMILYVHVLHPSINTTNRYNALSYTWGDPTDTTTLELVDASNNRSGKIFVTQSLITALKHFRDRKHHLAFWADQVCIDQSNLGEKEQQIALMKLIYERAGAVYAWLGPWADDSDLAMEKIVDSESLFQPRSRPPLAHHEGAGAPSPHVLSEVQEAQARTLNAIHALLCRPWWSRTWILQESTAQVPAQTLLCCGEKQVQMSTFLRFTDAIRARLVGPQSLHPGFERLLSLPFWPRFLAFLRSRESSGGKRPLLALVENVRDTTATDPRDKVYSMLNFALERNPGDPELRPDYSQTLRQTYTRLALWHIKKYQCLDVFGHCGQTNCVVNRTPSWVPDWTQGLATIVFPKFSTHDDPDSGPLFSASGAHSGGLKIHTSLPVDAQQLKLFGLKLGEIGNVLPERIAQTRGVEVEQTWRPLDKFRLCPLNNITLDEVFRATVYIDLKARFDEERRTIFKRQHGTEFPWPPNEVSNLETDYPDIVNLKRNTMGRCLFYTAAYSDGQGLMGLGPQDASVGDEVWKLKGGKVLYVLRQTTASEAVAYQSLDLSTGSSEDEALAPGDVVYKLVGECFILGLMDGKVLDVLGDEPQRPRPRPLHMMDRHLRKVGLI